jgi:transposase
MCDGGFMSGKSIKYLEVLERIKGEKITQKLAAKELNISVRQVYRIYQKFQKEGAGGFLSKKQGKPSNHQLPKIVKARVLELVTCEKYRGFGPTFMNEKLSELHSINISIETARRLMIECGAWHPNLKKRPVVHQQRTRRSRLGELTQIDGSPHLWFEDRGDSCCLIVFVDDATGRTFGRFFKTETCIAYMTTLAEYRLKYKGLPNCLYSDKHGIFRINMPNCVNKEQLTQFGRICKELGMGLICANSPQAKGRVERMNLTQQDRLVKELRLANICNIEDANEFLKTYWDRFNEKFNVAPMNPEDSHLDPLSDADFYEILCFKETRTITKNLEIQYKNTIYQVVNKHSKGLYRGSVTLFL